MSNNQYLPIGLSSAEITATIKRFVDPEFYKGNSKRERSAFAKLFSQYPDPVFWKNWALDFKLKSLYWLVGADGAEKLDIGYKMFKLNLDAKEPNNTPQVTLDNLFQQGQCSDVQLDYKDEYKIEISKPKTTADFLKKN